MLPEFANKLSWGEEDSIMAIGFVAFGGFLGLVGAVAVLTTGGGVLAAVTTLSAVGTLSTFALALAKAFCPETSERAETA